MLHHLIECRFSIALHPNTFECLCICGSNFLNDNYKAPIMLQLGLHVERDEPHTPCSHANKLKNVAKSQLHQCGLRHLRCVLQINLELIPFQECMPFSLSNNLLFIVMKPNQRVAQDLCIHCRMILNPRALLSNRWASRLVRLHGNIVMGLQMLPFVATRGGASTFKSKKKQKTYKLMSKLTIQMKIIPYRMRILHMQTRLKHMMKVLQRWI